MIALAASAILALYILVPSSIFRLIFGLFVPLRNFVRTRGEEIFRGVMTVVVPFLLALLLVWSVAPFKAHPFNFPDTPQLKRADYALIASALYSETVFREKADEFWKAMARTRCRQYRFLCWYAILVGAEGMLFGFTSIAYPILTGRRWYNRTYDWTAKKILLPNISEWYLLLTPFFFRDKKTVVWADILCSDKTLYRGRVVEHFLDKEGQLAGMIITEAKRYARDAYLKDKEKGAVKKEDYWRPIPGAKLYIFANQMLNLNLAYEGPEPPPNVLADVISRMLNETVLVETKSSS